MGAPPWGLPTNTPYHDPEIIYLPAIVGRYITSRMPGTQARTLTPAYVEPNARRVCVSAGTDLVAAPQTLKIQTEVRDSILHCYSTARHASLPMLLP